jgi:hypothetical protein
MYQEDCVKNNALKNDVIIAVDFDVPDKISLWNISVAFIRFDSMLKLEGMVYALSHESKKLNTYEHELLINKRIKEGMPPFLAKDIAPFQEIFVFWEKKSGAKSPINKFQWDLQKKALIFTI